MWHVVTLMYYVGLMDSCTGQIELPGCQHIIENSCFSRKLKCHFKKLWQLKYDLNNICGADVFMKPLFLDHDLFVLQDSGLRVWKAPSSMIGNLFLRSLNMEVNKWKEMADLVRDSSAHVYAQMGRLNSGMRKIRKWNLETCGLWRRCRIPHWDD